MARVPVGGELVKNPVQGPPGFTDRQCVRAGRRADGHARHDGRRRPRLRSGGGGDRRGTVRVEGAGEGVIAEPLEALAKAHPDLSLGSYPFFGRRGYGSNLVVRGRDAASWRRRSTS